MSTNDEDWTLTPTAEEIVSHLMDGTPLRERGTLRTFQPPRDRVTIAHGRHADVTRDRDT